MLWGLGSSNDVPQSSVEVDNQRQLHSLTEEKMSTAPVALGERGSGPSVAWSILLIILGLLAIASPLAASLGVVIVIGWLLLFDGVAQVVLAFQSKGAGHIAWKLLVAVVYLVAGVYLLVHPGVGVASLTFVLAIFFFAEGVVDIIAYFSTRKIGGSAWMLLDGIITLFLGVMIWRHWPSSSLWVIGLLVGISMLMTGMTRLMMALAIRRLARV
jgi:uncharacterized membrane protein HdeD (DUF308 family)